MSIINTNLAAQQGLNHLSRSKNQLTSAMERLSSGLRVNSARDDAAGQAISNRMSSQITGRAMAQRNANDGISLAQTAQGVLNSINDKLQRIRELAVQGLNGTLSTQDGDAVQAEINYNLQEIDRLASTAHYNGLPLLNGQAGQLQLQVGANDGEQIGIDLAPPGFSVKALGLEGLNVPGLTGDIIERNSLQGVAQDIPLYDANTTLTFATGSQQPLYYKAGYGYYANDGAGGFAQVNVSASHDTASDSNAVTVSNPRPLFNNQLQTQSVALPPLAHGERLVSAHGTLYLEQQQNDGSVAYYATDIALQYQSGSTASASLSNTSATPTTLAPADLSALTEVPATDFTNLSTIDFQGIDSNTFSALSLVQQTTNGQWMIRGESADGTAYFNADLSLTLGADGQPQSAVATAQHNTPHILLGTASDVRNKVSGHSQITIDPRNVTVDYTDSKGNSYQNVLQQHADGNYYFLLPGQSSSTGGYKTATLVDLDGSNEVLLRTLNGNSEVIVYHPSNVSTGSNFNITALTDADGFDDNGVAHTRLQIKENGEAFRLRTPRNPLAAIDRALSMVDSKRSYLGATENRLASTIDNNRNAEINLSAARSRIMDADYAVEVANMTRAQILQQAGTSVLAQANQMPQNVLSLLE